MSRFTDLTLPLDRFSHPLSQEMFQPESHTTDEYCPWCGSTMIEVKYPDTAIDYNEQTYYTGGGYDIYCPRGCC